MWQLSRQNKSRQIIGQNFFETDYFHFEKNRSCQIRTQTFAIPGKFVTSKTSAPETQKNLHLL